MLFAKKSFTSTPAELLCRLSEAVNGAAAPTVERAREWLVFAGQIEQAVRDASCPVDAETVTSHAAGLLLELMSGGSGRAQRARFGDAIRNANTVRRAVEVRIPEGFAWYALYPEAYAEAAERWAVPRRGLRVLVIGLRSIGTSLSAVVAGAFMRSGVRVARRITLRPHGDPFRRSVDLPEHIPAVEAVVVVDEGPGLSGSSMAGVAQALQRRGFREDAIFFFPGHGRGPGREADARVLRWWTAGRVVVGSAPEDLFRPAADRRWLFGGFAAVNGRLETLADMKRARQMRLAAQGFALPSPEACNGWIAISEAGRPLTVGDLSPDFVNSTLAPHLVAAACPAPERSTLLAALQRIASALGRGAGRLVAHVLEDCRGLPLAGDGRLGPDEWRLVADGRSLKSDATGTDCAHSWEGTQSILWDAGAALVEWEMDEAMRGVLNTALIRHGILATPLALAFHEAGYCALAEARCLHAGDRKRASIFAARRRAALSRMAVTA